MALFARAAKGPVAYGARHARTRPSIRQWLLAVRETVVIKPSRFRAHFIEQAGRQPVTNR